MPVYATENTNSEESDVELESGNWDGVTKQKIYENDEYKITFSLDSAWDTGYNATISIENVGEVSIQNWRLKYRFNNNIDAIWNAEISSCSEDEYVIKNVGWNQDIAAGGKVEFGFSGNQAFKGFPESFELVQNSMIVQENDYSVEYIVDGDWESGFYGSILVTNHTDSNIEEWILEFEFDREITEIWNGVIESHEGNHYTLRNAEYNSLLAPEESVSIGIKGSEGTADDVPCNYTLYACKESVTEEDNEGDISGGDEPDSPVSDGDISNGDISGGDISDGDVSQGDVTAGDSAEDVEEIQDYTRCWSDMLDTDGDGLPDEYENDIGTDIHNPDTDGDKLSDGYEELYSSTDPLDQYTLGNGVTDSELDPDEDGLTILEESKLGTDPLNPDSDEDELNDGEETGVYGTKPMEWDTDGDTISDGDEVKIGLNPLDAETYGYPDSSHKYETVIEGDSEILTNINAENENFQMSLELSAQGAVVSDLIVRESAYTDVISSDAILGVATEVIHNGDGDIENITVKFTIDSDKICETDNASDLGGIGKFNIFMYHDEENILVPLNTMEDASTNTISATVEQVGTFCVVDMEKWLSNLSCGTTEVPVETTTSESNTTEAKGKINEASKKMVDITFFVVNDAYEMYEFTEADLARIKKEILNTSRLLFDKCGDVRVFMYDMNGKWIFGKDSDGGYQGAKNIEQVEILLEQVIFKRSHVALDDDLRMLKVSPFRPEAFKAAVIIGNGYCYAGTEGYYKKVALNRDIHTFMVSPNMGEKSMYYRITRDTNGLLLNDYGDFANDIVDFIIGYEMPSASKVYHMITSTDLKTVSLRAELKMNGNTDTDSDNLTDWQEIRSDRVTVNSDGTIVLPTYYEYIQQYIGEEEWLKTWASKYYGVDGFEGKTIKEILEGIYVLPIKSDPTLVDSDGDGITDYNECVWDGVDERYRDLGPLHKDTIETLFPEFAKTEHNEPKNISYITVKDNDVVVHTKVTFSEGANENALKYLKKDGLDLQYQQACDDIIARVGENVTFKDLIKDALSSRWEGTYEGSAYDFYEGLKVNFAVVLEEVDDIDLDRAVRIKVEYGVCGVSNVSYWGWQTNCRRIVTLYTGYCKDASHTGQAGATCRNYMSSKYDIARCSGTYAHEFGHVWGLADMYANANNGYQPVANTELVYDRTKVGLLEGHGMMLCNGSAISNDVEMLLLAFSENKNQFFVPNGVDRVISKAIKHDVEFTNKNKIRHIYVWNEQTKMMELKQK